MIGPTGFLYDYYLYPSKIPPHGGLGCHFHWILWKFPLKFLGGLGHQFPRNAMETTSSNSHASREEVPWNSQKSIIIIISNIYSAIHQILGLEYLMN